jgi:hypothetical protein
MRLRYIVVVTFALALAIGAGARAAQPIAGQGVIVSGMQPMQAFLREKIVPGGVVHFDMWEIVGSRVVRTYDVDMTKLMHMIVVTDDLRLFEHVHPTLQPDGHFTIDLPLPQRGLYHIYLDGLVRGVGRTVFRFDVPLGSSAPAPPRMLHAARSSVQVGPYVVTIDPTSLPIGEIATLSVSITQNGRPAHDLHPYLGAMAHGVFVGVNDLAYMHAHGMSARWLAMSSANDCGDAMMLSMPPIPPKTIIDSRFEFQVLAPRAQDYDLWFQFIGGKTIYTAPFLVTAR